MLKQQHLCYYSCQKKIQIWMRISPPPADFIMRDIFSSNDVFCALCDKIIQNAYCCDGNLNIIIKLLPR